MQNKDIEINHEQIKKDKEGQDVLLTKMYLRLILNTILFAILVLLTFLCVV